MMFFIRRYIATFFCVISFCQLAYGITPEQVLGEYWKDPLFGKAASEHTINLEVLHRRIWPMEIKVPTGKNIRFVVQNKTSEAHLIAFSAEPETLMADDGFKKFAQDELYHASQKAEQGAGHHHHHDMGDAADETQDIVKTLDQKPTVFVSAHDQKEMLINFSKPQTISIFCTLDGHVEDGYISRLDVLAEIPSMK